MFYLTYIKLIEHFTIIMHVTVQQGVLIIWHWQLPALVAACTVARPDSGPPLILM